MSISGKQTKISVKVQPNAGHNEVVNCNGGVWRLKIAAPPDKGKANKELVEFLSDILDVRKDCINIQKGLTSHNKIIAIEGLNAEDVADKLGSR